MSRRIVSPNRTYFAMTLVRGKGAGGRENNENNSFQTLNTRNCANVSRINAQLPNVPTCTTIDLDMPATGPLRKLEPPDAPHPNQENNQHNYCGKTGENGADIIRITKNITKVQPKNHQVHQSDDLSDPKPTTSKSAQVSDVSTIGTKILRKRLPPACFNVDSSSNSDDSSDSVFFSKRKNINTDRLPYTGAEDLEILRFVLEGDNIFRTSSISLWKELESEKRNPRRTFHSLKNRFLRNIKPFILMRYGKFVTAEKEKMLLKKFPELSKRKKTVKTHSCIPIEGYQNKEPSHPCLAKKKVCPLPPTPDLPTSTLEKEPLVVRTFKDVSVGTEEYQVRLVSPPANKTCENCKLKEPPVPGIELKKRGKLKGVTCQTFEYSAALCSFKKEAAVNLNLVLTRDSADSGKTSKRTLLDETDKPINVRVTVTLSTGATKRNLKRCGRRRRKKSKSRPEKFYVLGLRKGTRGKWKRKARLYEETVKAFFSEIEKRRKAADEERRRGMSDSEDEVRPMVLRSQTRTIDTQEDEVRPMVLRSQTRTIDTQEDERGSITGFESSSDDGSYIDEARRKVESMYQVLILPSPDMEGSQESEVWKGGRENQKTSGDGCRSIGLLNNMVSQMGLKDQNAKR